MAYPAGRSYRGKTILLVRLHAKPLRDIVIRNAKSKAELTDATKITEDLIKYDFDLKRQAYPQMKSAYKEGKKVKFVKGRLIVDGEEIDILQGIKPQAQTRPSGPTTHQQTLHSWIKPTTPANEPEGSAR